MDTYTIVLEKNGERIAVLDMQTLQKVVSKTMQDIAEEMSEPAPKPGGFVQQAREAAKEYKRDQLDRLADLAQEGRWTAEDWKEVTYFKNDSGKESWCKSIEEARKTADFYKSKGWPTTKKFGKWIENGLAKNRGEAPF